MTKPKIKLYILVSIILATVIPLGLYEILPFYVTTIADTGSMKPVLDGGDKVILRTDVTTDDIEVGDIVTYKSTCSHRNLVTHRVVDTTKYTSGLVAEKALITKGDNTPNTSESDQAELTCSKPVTDSDIVGLYFNHIDS